MKIGFVGLGIMGKPMALNLLKAGHDLVVRNASPEAEQELAAAGASVAATPREVAAASELVITMLPNSPHVREAALGADGLIEGAHEGLTLIDMSSIAPLIAREVGEALAEAGVAMLDAPVSGGEPGAIAGTLAIMVGGEREVFDRYRDVLLQVGATATYVGPLGSGNIAKLANQTIVAVNIAAVAEALTLAVKAGADPAAVVEAIRGGLAGSKVLDAKAPMMLDRTFAPGFRINLHIKDLGNVLDTGHGVDAPLPLTAAVREMMTALSADGLAGDDHSSLVRYYEKLGNCTVTRHEPTS